MFSGSLLLKLKGVLKLVDSDCGKQLDDKLKSSGLKTNLPFFKLSGSLSVVPHRLLPQELNNQISPCLSINYPISLNYLALSSSIDFLKSLLTRPQFSSSSSLKEIVCLDLFESLRVCVLFSSFSLLILFSDLFFIYLFLEGVSGRLEQQKAKKHLSLLTNSGMNRYVENQGLIEKIDHFGSNSKTKHLEIKMRWLRDLKLKDEIRVTLIPSENMIAGTLTKSSCKESLN
ncbi:hypothetical protein VP01_4151g1 [Puccinia sorghi]|uniref:Uncharacterized protein n=1 Tax=Puccinia sorghi TaxID=27349 RepID=A0A0L6UR03_9BASI|nr:hypothetical protein VP01_4151g1 [Puccinia sorghi]